MDSASQIPSEGEEARLSGEPALLPEHRRAGALEESLAGFQAGMTGAFAMLVWLGISSAWQGRGFWRTENLMASAFYHAGAMRSGFGAHTLSGLSLYLVIYTLLGALAALLLRDRMARVRTLLVCIVIGVCWYYVSFRWMWRTLAPPLALLHVERATILGHVIYGLWLGRFPEYLVGGRGSGIRDQATGSGDPEPAVSDQATQAPVTGGDANQLREP